MPYRAKRFHPNNKTGPGKGKNGYRKLKQGKRGNQTMIKLATNVYVSKDEIVLILPATGRQQEKILRQHKEADMLWDFTAGKRTQSLVLIKNGMLLKSANTAKTLQGRFNGKEELRE